LINLVNYVNTLRRVIMLTLDKILLYNIWNIILPNDELLKQLYKTTIYLFISIILNYFLNSEGLIF